MMPGYFVNTTPSRSSSTVSKISTLCVEEKGPEKRFCNYFNLLSSRIAEALPGNVEPHDLKSLRPFLHSAEATEGAVKTPRDKKQELKKEICQSFGWGTPIPHAEGFISANSVYRHNAEFTAGTLTSSAVLPTFASFNFTANSLGDLSSLTGLFDQYRITKIEAWIMPNVLDSTVNSTGILYTCVDYDDSSALTTVQQAQNYTNVLFAPTTEGQYRAFTPHAAVALYSGVFTSFGNEVSPWIDAASAGVEHYGLKLACSVIPNGVIFTVNVRMHTEWRNSR